MEQLLNCIEGFLRGEIDEAEYRLECAALCAELRCGVFRKADEHRDVSSHNSQILALQSSLRHYLDTINRGVQIADTELAGTSVERINELKTQLYCVNTRLSKAREAIDELTRWQKRVEDQRGSLEAVRRALAEAHSNTSSFGR